MIAVTIRTLLRARARVSPCAQTLRRRSGAAAIEFAAVFPFFFLLLYGFINYGLILALQQSMVVAAEDGARAAIACDPTLDADEHTDCVSARARLAAGVALSWLPELQRDLILGSDNGNVQVAVDDAATPHTVSVVVEYPHYADQPILPVLSLPMIGGSIPPVPERLVAQSLVQLSR